MRDERARSSSVHDHVRTVREKERAVSQGRIHVTNFKTLSSFYLSMLRPQWETLNQFRPSAPLWSETLWPTFVKHVAISAQLILRIFTSYFYDKFGQLKKFIDYTLGSSESNGLHKKSPCLSIPDINFKIAVTRFAKVNNQQYPQ